MGVCASRKNPRPTRWRSSHGRLLQGDGVGTAMHRAVAWGWGCGCGRGSELMWMWMWVWIGGASIRIRCQAAEG